MRTALIELRRHPSRVAAVLLAIAISVAFVAASLIFTATETRAIGRSITAQTAASDVVVELSQDPKGDLQQRMAAVPGVRSVEPSYTGYADFGSARGAGQLMLYSLPTDPALRWANLSAGVWPTGARQVVVDRSTAEQYGLGIGSDITVAHSGPTATLQVSGITDQSRSLFSGLSSSAFVTPAYFTSQSEPPLPAAYLVLDDQTAPATVVADRIRALVPADSTVQTSEEFGAAALDQLTRGADVFRYLLLGFGGIALLVGSIIITNTFTILLTQRRRQIGLLRAIGASTTQVRIGVLTEAVVVGVVGSAVGLVLGLGIGVAATAVTGSLATGLVVPVTIVGAALLGVVVTVLAALLPAARAMRVAPLEALRPVADEVTARRSTVRLRNVACLVIALGGAAVVVALRAPSHNLVLAIAGSMVLAVGILAAAPVFLPAALRGVGRLSGRTGPVARLAAANTIRNPGRAAATCTALMLGVGLIVTLQVGAASIKTTFDDTLDTQFPVDLAVTNPSGPLSPDVVTGVRRVPGVQAAAPVLMSTVQVGRGADLTGSDWTQLRAAGLSPEVGSVVSGGFDQLSDRTVLAQASTLKRLGVRAGNPLTLGYDHHTLTRTAVASDIPGSGTVAVTQTTLTQLDPAARVGAVWASVPDRSAAKTVIADVRIASGAQPGLELSGSLNEAAALDTVLDALLSVATGLLAVAVLIALIGVGNTLGLSVVERTQESALLRALGLQRRELRMMLAVEAAMLALVGAAVGIAAGVLFGWIGTAAMVKQSDLGRVHFSMSAVQTVTVVGVALVAGVLASVIPGRRAALAAPTSALAEV